MSGQGEVRDPTPEERRAFSAAEAEVDLEIWAERRRLAEEAVPVNEVVRAVRNQQRTRLGLPEVEHDGREDIDEFILGTTEVSALAGLMQNLRLCELGYHAWTPYLGLPADAPNRYVTWCAREGCDGAAQYDL